MKILIERWNKFIEGYGWVGLLRLIFYPLTTLVTTPVRLVQTLWACRVLADGRWGDYTHFIPRKSINYLFYWTRALNLYRYGRSGKSPCLGLGNYNLSRCFHYSLPSLYAYWIGGVVSILAGMFGWWLSHLIWIGEVNISWLILIMSVSMFSTTFYANTFGLQNYNAIGWAFFPIGIYGLINGQWLTTSLGWLGASFGSFTVVFIAIIISVTFAITNWSIEPLIALLPATLKLLTHFYPFLLTKDLNNTKKTLINLLKAIGFTKRSVKYKRSFLSFFRVLNLYYLILYIQFAIFLFYFNHSLPIIFIISLVIVVVNEGFTRFADVQSMYMLMFSASTAAMLQLEEPLLLISYWVLISPLPMSGFTSLPNVFDVVPKLYPISIENLINGMNDFLDPVRSGERVLMAFDNPNGLYEKVFDGYRVLLELPLYVAATKKIHFMPDWWGVFELNYEGAPDFWGRGLNSVLENLKQWNADYVVIYQDSETELDSKWVCSGFEVLNKFSWKEYHNDLQGIRPYSGQTPDWWLLKKNLY